MSILEDLETLPDPSKKFLEWSKRLLVRDPVKFELVLESVMRAGLASTPYDALIHLNTVVRKFSFDGLHITSTDLGLRKQRGDPFAELAAHPRIRRSTPAGRDPTRLYGIVGHLLMPRLLGGALARKNQPKTQLELFPGQSALRDARYDELAIAIERAWTELSLVMRNSTGYEWFYGKRAPIERFYALVESFFGEYASRILKKSFFADEYLVFLTFMSWASALAYHRRTGTQELIPEIPAITPTHGVDGGRVDAIAVEMNADGKTCAFPMDTFRSAGEAMALANRLDPSPAWFVIKDWKFAVGDGNSRLKRYLIADEEVAEGPISDHVRQMERYLALAYCDFLLYERRMHAHDPCLRMQLRGELVYFLPDRLPIIHAITPNQERITAMIEELRNRWKHARSEARFREVTRLIVAYAVRALATEHGGSHTPSANLVNQGLLFPGDILEHPIERIVHSYVSSNQS